MLDACARLRKKEHAKIPILSRKILTPRDTDHLLIYEILISTGSRETVGIPKTGFYRVVINENMFCIVSLSVSVSTIRGCPDSGTEELATHLGF